MTVGCYYAVFITCGYSSANKTSRSIARMDNRDSSHKGHVTISTRQRTGWNPVKREEKERVYTCPFNLVDALTTTPGQRTKRRSTECMERSGRVSSEESVIITDRSIHCVLLCSSGSLAAAASMKAKHSSTVFALVPPAWRLFHIVAIRKHLLHKDTKVSCK